MAYQKTRKNAEETVFDWRTDHPDWEDLLEFESYDPSTNCVFVEQHSEISEKAAKDLESHLRDKLDNETVVGIIKTPDYP